MQKVGQRYIEISSSLKEGFLLVEVVEYPYPIKQKVLFNSLNDYAVGFIGSFGGMYDPISSFKLMPNQDKPEICE